MTNSLLESLIYKNFRRKAGVYVQELRVELEKLDLSDADKSTINEVLDTVATRINSWTVWGTEESDISKLLLSIPDMNSIQTIKKKLIELF
jgi:C4-type Zn-finger protein